jgi:hypothetical protein
VPDCSKSDAQRHTARHCKDDVFCPFYLEIKNENHTKENLQHMDEFRHTPIICQDGTQCSAFNRMAEHNGFRIDDRGHCSIYFHPGRRGLTQSENLGSRKFVSAALTGSILGIDSCHAWNYDVDDADLVNELEKNGFGHVMKPTIGPYKSLYEVVDEKLEHPRHKRIGSPLSREQMLAIILYTDTDVYIDLRWDEIQHASIPFNENQQKWPVLGKVLEEAICILSQADDQCRPDIVYHGLKDIEIDPKKFNNEVTMMTQGSPHDRFGYGTFVSTSWNEHVALGFMSGQGLLLKIILNHNEYYRRVFGADVSWISKFPLESEYLIARSVVFFSPGNDIYFDTALNCQVVEVQPRRHGT